MKRKLAVVVLVPLVALGLVGCADSTQDEPIAREYSSTVPNSDNDSPDCDDEDALYYEEPDCGYYDNSGYWVWYGFVSQNQRDKAYAKGKPSKGIKQVHPSHVNYGGRTNSAPTQGNKTAPNNTYKPPVVPKPCGFMGLGKPGNGGGSSTRSNSTSTSKGWSWTGKGNSPKPGC